jgi:hypothetical protein
MIPLRDTIPSRTFPFINYTFILLNLVVFFYQVSLGHHLERFIYAWGIVPADFFAPLSYRQPGLIERVIPLFTSMFLHGGWLHLLGNMLFLYIFGDNVEDRLGHTKYFFFYILCGVLAVVAHLMTNPSSRVPTIGASGAIAGVMGAYFFLFPYARIVTLIFIFFFIDIIEIPAFFFLAFWLILQFLNGTMSFSAQNAVSGGVAWWAHIGGFIAGILLLFVFGVRRTTRRLRLYS